MSDKITLDDVAPYAKNLKAAIKQHQPLRLWYRDRHYPAMVALRMYRAAINHALRKQKEGEP